MDGEEEGTGVVEGVGSALGEKERLDVTEPLSTKVDREIDGVALTAVETLVDGEKLLGGETLGE